MIEVKVDAKKHGNIFFNVYIRVKDCELFFGFKENYKDYENNLTYYGNDVCNFLESFYIKNNSLNNNDFEIYKEEALFSSGEYFIFEFLDDYPEEELFYFKMKYG